MYTIEERVNPSKTDGTGRLKLVSAIDMLQDCSQLWMESEPEFRNYFQENNINQLVASRQVDVIRIPSYGEKLRVQTSVYECQGFQGYRNTAIYDKENRPCYVSWTTGAFVSSANGRLTKIPPQVTGLLTIDPKIDMEYLDRKIVLPDGKTEDRTPIAVKRNDIDMNKHMNNAKYVQVAVELLPADFDVSRLRIEYKTPAVLGNLLYPKVITANSKIYVILSNENNNPYTIMEFCSKKSLKSIHC